jgi:HK97 family phage prohead protease
MEHRHFEFDMKEATEGLISGHGAIFDTVDEGGDLIVKGAFDKTLASGRQVKMLWQHDPSHVIGLWDSISVDDKGLKVKGHIIPEIPKGMETLALLKAKAIEGLSIGYRTLDFEMVSTKDRTRRLKEIDLFEVSVVTFPMNSLATVTDVKQLQSPREVERLLRDAGVPGAFAKLVSIHGYDEAMTRLGGHREGDDEAKAQEAIRRLLVEIHGLKEIINA